MRCQQSCGFLGSALSQNSYGECVVQIGVVWSCCECFPVAALRFRPTVQFAECRPPIHDGGGQGSGSLRSVVGQRPRRKRHPQCIQHSEYVDDLLKHCPGDGRQIACGRGHHANEAQRHPADGAL